MSDTRSISQELSIGEVVSRTFDAYRRGFVKYVLLFAIVEAISGVLTTLVRNAYVLPTLPANPTTDQVSSYLSSLVGTLVPLIAFSAVIALVFIPVAVGATIKMTSEEIEKGQADLAASVKFSVSKLVWMWALGILVGIIVSLGFIALIIPGIILGIMFCMSLNALLIENTGIFGSMTRSRELVSHRWLKTFGTFLVILIIVGIAAAIVNLISSPFGEASTIVSSILSSLYVPLLPIALTVYYYSNLARISPSQGGQAMAPNVPGAQAGLKYCPNCGTQMPASAVYCPKCGIRTVP
jgi:hypothetical protein